MQKPGIRLLIILLAVSIITGLLSVGIHAALGNNRIGADFYFFWTAARAAFIEGQSPYSPEVTAQIQQGIYGRSAEPSEDQMIFAYPAHSLLLVGPLAWLPFDWAQALWMALGIIGLVLLPLVLFPRAPLWVRLSLILYYPVAFALILGNFNLPVMLALLVFWSRFTIRESHPASAEQISLGFLLSIATIKPQLVWAFVLLAVLLAFRRRTYILLGSFAGFTLLFLLIPFTFIPNWAGEWLAQIQYYTTFEHAGGDTVQVMLLQFLSLIGLNGWAATAIAGMTGLAGLIGLLCLVFRKFSRPAAPLIALGLAGLLIYVLHPSGLSYEQLAMILPMFIWAALRGTPRPAVLFFWLGGLLLSWGVFSLARSLSQNWILYLPPTLWTLAWWLWLLLARRRPAQT
ncbi:MAG TPA: glycosyltransferase family 87 protein [Anaerolineaceae bacterium]|nr:glycosyltransferase family 87 protein [Anaerolineaceae bacterium]